MPLTFPDWYKGGFPDREVVVMDALQPFWDSAKVPGAPTGFLCTWLPDDTDVRVAAGEAVIRVYRGGLSDDGIFDPAAVQVAVIAKTHRDAAAGLEYCRQVLLGYSGGAVKHPDGSYTAILKVQGMQGPQQARDENPDDRLVNATFNVECRLPRDIPDYAPTIAAIVRSL